jgi:hypothetical protein
MARYIDADLLLERIYPYNGVDKSKYAINAKAVFEAIRKSPTADVVPKSEVAREIIDELLEALQGEVDAEEKLESSAWDESDMIGHYMHQYALEKLETLVIALSLYKKKYTEDQT